MSTARPFEVAERMFAADRASEALGMQIGALSQRSATVTMTVTEAMVNGYGITHGGFVFAVADTAFALACNSGESSAVAARADIRFLRPSRLGDTLTATAQERETFGRNGIYDVTVAVGDTVVAEFRGDGRTILGAPHP